jgi:hypothetical protein
MGGNGPIEVDETFIGPNPRKMHADKRETRYKALKARPNIPVMGLLDRDSRQVRAQVVRDVKRETLRTRFWIRLRRDHPSTLIAVLGTTTLRRASTFMRPSITWEEYVRGEGHTQGLRISGAY